MSQQQTNRSGPNQQQQQEDRYCHFCVRGYQEVDYRDTRLLTRFTSSYAKILPRRKTGVCTWHQRKLSEAIKRSRFMALMPFVKR